MSEQESVLAALSATDLVRFEMRPVPVLDTGEVAFCWEVPVAEGQTLWRQAASYAKALGRWPVLVLQPFYPDTFSRFYYEGSGDQSPRAVIQRAETMALEQVWDVYPSRSSYLWDDETWDHVVEVDLTESAARVGHPPPLSLDAARRMNPDFDRFERLLFAWEEERRPTAARDEGRHLDWEPWFDDTCGLLLMPTVQSWRVPAYTTFFGASRPMGHEALVRVMREWRHRFGADLVASWGTELQFRVERPPTDIETAYELALQQAAIAPYTLAGPGVSVR